MKIEVSKAIGNDFLLRPLVEHANELLTSKIVPATEAVTIKWDLDPPKGRKFLTLDIMEEATGDRGSTAFNPDELTEDNYLLQRLHGVWGDLLQERSHRLLKALAG